MDLNSMFVKHVMTFDMCLFAVKDVFVRRVLLGKRRTESCTDKRGDGMNSSKSYKWIVLVIATLAQTCATFVTYGVGPLATFYQQQLDLSQFKTGLIVSAVNIGPIFSMIIFGDLMDRYGEKWSIGVGAILLGLSMSLAIFANDFYFLLFILLLVGVWYGTAQPGGSSIIVKWFPRRRRGLAMGIRQMGIPLGGALASIILPFMYFTFNLNGAIITQSIVVITGGILFLLIYKDIPFSFNHQKEQQIKLMEKINAVRKNKSLYPIFYIGCSMISVQLIIVAHLMSYFNNELDKELNVAGMFLSIALVGGLIGRVAISWISDSLYQGNRETPLQITILLTSIVMVLLVLLPENTTNFLFAVVTFLFGFLGMGWFSLFIVLLSERARPELISLTVSFGLTLNQLFIVFSPAAFGFIVDMTGNYVFPFILLAIVVLIGPVWLGKSSKDNLNAQHPKMKSRLF